MRNEVIYEVNLGIHVRTLVSGEYDEGRGVK